MVKRRQIHYQSPQGFIEPQAWLATMRERLPISEFITLQKACELAEHLQKEQRLPNGFSPFQQGLNIAEILAELQLDPNSLSAAILMYFVENGELRYEDIVEGFNTSIAKLIAGAIKMSAISATHKTSSVNKVDNLRKMILAMVEDIRVVLIKLAEQTFLMRNINQLEESNKQELANLTFDIYAPLANRLGVGHLKWELEDLAFRYLTPDEYKQLAKALDATRIEREHYVEKVKTELSQTLHDNQINDFEITGRAKHIYSIYKKMKRKNVGYDQIYDITAVRVLTKEIPDCYAILSCVHTLWPHISAEFDDYITHPKPNGYRSIHTAVVGPDNKSVEVQIRTFQMHQESELGVAAHWKYKEGARVESSFEEKINWLRQLLEWQQELSATDEKQADIKHLFADRVYVFTPAGEIIDLPLGATPLDFAYHIHTQLGHRCKGAKINGHIVPLTYQLKTADKVDILTGKQANPSRDWLNPHSGYLITSRARAKVFHWFKMLDHDEHVDHGRQQFEKELRHHHLPPVELLKLSRKLHFKTPDDLFAAIGLGELKLTQVVNAIKQLTHTSSLTETTSPKESVPAHKESLVTTPQAVSTGDIAGLMSSTAKCCKPLPGDEIIGFITRGRGITLHRANCPNIIKTPFPERLMPMSWEAQKAVSYPVDIILNADDRTGLIRDVSTCIINEKVKLLNLNSTLLKDNSVVIYLTLEVNDLGLLQKLLDKLGHIPSILSVKRKATQ